MKFDLVFECELPHPVERVWWALTDRNALAGWFMQTDLAAELGAGFTMRGKPEGAWRGWTECGILECVQSERIDWSFDAEEGVEPTRVTFELRSQVECTFLRLTHSGTASAAIAGQLGRGWPVFLVRLDPFLRDEREAAL